MCDSIEFYNRDNMQTRLEFRINSKYSVFNWNFGQKSRICFAKLFLSNNLSTVYFVCINESRFLFKDFIYYLLFIIWPYGQIILYHVIRWSFLNFFYEYYQVSKYFKFYLTSFLKLLTDKITHDQFYNSNNRILNFSQNI